MTLDFSQDWHGLTRILRIVRGRMNWFLPHGEIGQLKIIRTESGDIVKSSESLLIRKTIQKVSLERSVLNQSVPIVYVPTGNKSFACKNFLTVFGGQKYW